MTPPAGRHCALLVSHLERWLGGWPPRRAVDVIGADERTRPAWDGRPALLVGVGTRRHTVLSVAPERADAVADAVGPLDDGAVRRAVADAAGAPDMTVGRGVFRWSRTVVGTATLPEAGEWVDPDDPRVPEWLQPFNYGQVLIAWDGEGRYGAGVGIKRHDPVGHELAVVTTPLLQGRGYARRLIAQAARRVIDEGGLPTYLHAPDNVASARVADAVGFVDRGWSVYGLFERRDGASRGP